jgi:mannose-6-phosphate isomerase-like protein (cupin superfamily)
MRRCSFAFLISALVFLAAPAQSSEPAKADSARVKYDIDNCVNEFSPARIESTKVGYQYWFVDSTFVDGRTLKMSVVAPHSATHPPHAHPEDEFFFVLEGRAEFYLDGRTRLAGPYTSFYCPSGYRHGIRNVGDTTLKYLVIKKYGRK